MQFHDVGMTEEFHGFQLSRQKLLLEVEWCLPFADNLQGDFLVEILRERPFDLETN